MDKSLIPGLIGSVVGLIGIIFGWAQHRRHAQVDESALVLNKWKEFAEIHQRDMLALKQEMASDRQRYNDDRHRYEEELTTVRRELREVQAELISVRKDAATQIRNRDEEIAKLKEQIAGWVAQFRQVSQSTAVQITRVRDRANKAEGKTKSKDIADDEIRERLDRIDRAGHNSAPGEDGK